MRFSESWLREWVNPEISTEELVHLITMAGLEVDGVEPACAEFTHVVVGEVLSTRPHPDADKLTLCEVATGTGTVPVVCGAPNVRQGMKVPLACVGAVLPGGLKIKKAKLRGEPSEGMLCGASELGLVDRIDGLLELPADAPTGMSFRDYLNLDDSLIEVDLTPNRADCFSLRGIAREVGALTRHHVQTPDIAKVVPGHNETFPVHIQEKKACPRYLGRVIKGVDIAAPSPLWLVEKLRRSGVRSIDPVVDVTNYVLMELGQPLHAFDLDTLSGHIEVRKAKKGESLVLLDEQVIQLEPDTLVIADQQHPLALAGIMGGKSSAVSATTHTIFLECAFFAPLAIVGKARSYGLHTDSSHRFERGVDPKLQEQALERATALILDIAGGEAGPVVTETDQQSVPGAVEIELRAERIEALLGLHIPADDVEDMLGRLGMEVASSEAGNGWTVLVPSWRFDMEREEDLIEELARVYGYDKLPSHLPAIANTVEAVEPEAEVPLRRMTDLLVSRGYHEVISYSFVAPDVQQALDPHTTPLALKNPISSELGVMRTSLWAGLLTTARYNLNRQQDRLRLFETGLCFRAANEAAAVTVDNLHQRPCIAGLLYGGAGPESWEGKARSVDFFDMKGDVQALLSLSASDVCWSFEAIRHTALHPGQSARILRNEREVGVIGKIHPQVARELDVSTEIYLFELVLNEINQTALPAFSPLSDQPSVRRDLAVVVENTVPAARLLDVVRAAAGSQLDRVHIFDVYQGDKLEKNKKSIALGLTFSDHSSTLRDSQVNDLIEAVVSQLKQEFNAVLRD